MNLLRVVTAVLLLSLAAPAQVAEAETPQRIDNVPQTILDPLPEDPLPLSPLESPLVTILEIPLVADDIGEPLGTERTLTFSLPVLITETTREILSRPHHDYPAADIVVPVGTVVHAVTGGLITLASNSDGGACGGIIMITTNDLGVMTYCHLSGVWVGKGQVVAAGQEIGLSGGRPGMRGAGSSTIPHIHIGWQRNGRSACPQPLLLSIWDGDEPNLVPSTRCIH